MDFKKHTILILILSLFIVETSAAQFVDEGKITFKRRTNLEKKFGDNKMLKQWLGGKTHKEDYFELFFNDTCSLFRPQPSDVPDRLSWATSKNTVYQVSKRDYRLTKYSVFMDYVFIKDSLHQRTWKITGDVRDIVGYQCKEAIWEMNDSTTIYAWYAEELIPSVGPESFVGLPGTILGVATEDGGIVYFAEKIEKIDPEIKSKIPEVKDSKLTTQTKLRAKFEKELSQYPWAEKALNTMFAW